MNLKQASVSLAWTGSQRHKPAALASNPCFVMSVYSPLAFVSMLKMFWRQIFASCGLKQGCHAALASLLASERVLYRVLLSVFWCLHWAPWALGSLTNFLDFSRGSPHCLLAHGDNLSLHVCNQLPLTCILSSCCAQPSLTWCSSFSCYQRKNNTRISVNLFSLERCHFLEVWGAQHFISKPIWTLSFASLSAVCCLTLPALLCLDLKAAATVCGAGGAALCCSLAMYTHWFLLASNLSLLLGVLEQARPVGVDQEMDYESKNQLRVMITK